MVLIHPTPPNRTALQFRPIKYSMTELNERLCYHNNEVLDILHRIYTSVNPNGLKIFLVHVQQNP